MFRYIYIYNIYVYIYIYIYMQRFQRELNQTQVWRYKISLCVHTCQNRRCASHLCGFRRELLNKIYEIRQIHKRTVGDRSFKHSRSIWRGMAY